MQEISHHRYILHDLLGQGAMGSVFRAYDRLTQQTVALKRLDVNTKALDFSTATSHARHKNLRLLLANEFQHLATLRHPHIIKVLDYGFDSQRHPFFTMTYLDDAVTLLEAGEGKTTEEKIALLLQVLEAMTYLHQRGVMHRDLKPANILVRHGHAYLLDFGLAVALEKAQGRAGTLVYMAPEVLLNAVALPASDLYSLGVIAYRLFTGQLPYEIENLMDIAEKVPDMTPFAGQPRLRTWLGNLLEKDPTARTPTPREALTDLYAVLEQPLPPEPLAFQESFLQAARLIGRRAELDTLTEALKQARKGQGSAWLIGGESGVGKSRLLDELGIRALVTGAMVLRGQAVEGGGMPYQLWREAARQLALSTPLTPLESGVLRDIAPDLETLLARPIPEPPALDARFKHQRLIYTFANIVQKAAEKRPLVFILEDLHWSRESLDLLPPLLRICPEARILILANFRPEDQPDLPETLAGMTLLPLKRLTAAEVTELAVSMLGKAGEQAQVLSLLQKETEGNTYFLIETIRALAENAGGVEAIGSATLPSTVFAGGVQTILQRRLRRVPDAHLPLVKFAAIAGRQIDPALLQAYAPHLPIESWLTHSTHLAILEAQENGWRFAHDKLRETLLHHLPKAERRTLHKVVARTIERLYAADLAPYYGILAAHYQHAKETARERHFVLLAAKQAIAQYANKDALQYLTRALELTPEEDVKERFDLLLERAKIYDLTSQREAQLADIQTLEGLAPPLGVEAQVRFLLQKFPAIWFSENTEAATVIANQAYELAHQIPGPPGIKFANQARIAWARTAYSTGATERVPTAITYLKETLARAQTIDDVEALASASGLLGHLLWFTGKNQEAQAYLEQSLVWNRQIGNRRTEASILNGLGNVAVSLGDHARAIPFYEGALAVEREIGYRLGEAIELYNLAYLKLNAFDFREALECLQQGFQAQKEIGLEEMMANSHYRAAGIYERIGAMDEAKASLEKGRALAEKFQLDDLFGRILQAQFIAPENPEAAQEMFHEILARTKQFEPTAIPLRLVEAGNIFLRLRQFSRAQAWFEYPYEEEPGLLSTVQELKAGQAAVAFAQGDLAKARPLVDDLLAYQATDPDLNSFAYPEVTFLVCYQVLKATGDPRTPELLRFIRPWLDKIVSHLPEGFAPARFWQAHPERQLLYALAQSNF